MSFTSYVYFITALCNIHLKDNLFKQAMKYIFEKQAFPNGKEVINKF